MPKHNPSDLSVTSSSQTATRAPTALIVAVVGANSFLGRNLVGVLEANPRVVKIVALDIERPSTAGPKTRYYETDIAQPNADEAMAEIFSAENVESLVHVAFLSTPTHSTEWAHEFESIGTMHLLNAVRRSRIRKVVQWSQTFLYGAQPATPNFIPETHPLMASGRSCFCSDKIDAENEVQRFAERSDCVVTVLRTAPILGPTVHNYLTNYLSHRFVPTLMGFDPMWQVLHEMDAVRAFEISLDKDVPGTFNIVSRGLLRLSTVVHLAGCIAVPTPHSLAFPLSKALWMSQASNIPPGFLEHLRYPCLADGSNAQRHLEYVPAFSAQEAIQDFAKAQRLRNVQLIGER